MKLNHILIVAFSWLFIGMVNAQNASENITPRKRTPVAVGDNVSNSNYAVPYNNFYYYSTVQTLYTPAEIGKSGKINSIAFKVATASTLYTSEVKIYLGHKSSTFSGTTDYVRSSNLTLVYSGAPTLGKTTGWETLTFNQNEFTYNGIDNLVVVVTKKCFSYNSSLTYYSFTGSGYTLRRQSDDYTGYGDVTNTSYSYNTSTIRPSVKFDIEETGTSGETITIGNTASNKDYYVPYNNYYQYSTVQTLYTPAEIGKSGKINSIAFKVATASTLYTSEVKIYLGHKSSTFSGTTDYVRSSNLTLVYSGAPTLGKTTGWETLTFNQNEFTYNGTDNLVVVVTKKCSSYNSSLKYYYFTGSGYTLTRRSDDYTGYGDVTNTSYSYDTSTNRPSVKFSIEEVPVPILADTEYTANGIEYTLRTDGTATVKALTESWTEVEIPNTVSYNNYSFKVTEVGSSAFSNYVSYAVTLPSSITTLNPQAFYNSYALSVIWNGSVKLTSSYINQMKENNPNVLIYVNSTNNLYSTDLQQTTNLVVSTTASNVLLTDKYNFHCPKQFRANTISYTRNFSMTSGLDGESAGWETIALPFYVETIRHSTKGELIPFANYSSTSTKKPFWLYSWGSSGWVKASSIYSNTPYLICMPNNEYYYTDYNLAGDITFSATYATVYKSSTEILGYSSSSYDSRSFYPTFVGIVQHGYVYNINSGTNSTETNNETPGSVFIRNYRSTKPFEGFIYSTSTSASRLAISLPDNDESTGVIDIMKESHSQEVINVYDVKGVLVTRTSADNLKQALHQLPPGIYIANGKKIMVKDEK